MKIIKQPKYNECTCTICGTVFRPEPSDELQYCFKNEIGIDEFDIFARCPTCAYLCSVTVTKEENKGKYFTPSEVKKMTPREVKENYDDIVESMKGWN